jgi:type II secretory pathway component PulF
MNANSIKPSEWALFYKLLGNLLLAGYSPVESLTQLMQEPLSEKMQTQLRPLLATLPPTASLTDCLKLKAFSLDAATIDLFEKAARVEDRIDLLQALSARYSQTNWINQLRGDSLNWPLVYFIIGAGLLAIITYSVLPHFARFYEGYGGTLPKAASLLLVYGYWVFFLLLLLIVVLLVIRFRMTPLALVDRLRLIRPWGVLGERIALARFTHMLALLLSKNIAPRIALIMATTAAENVVIERHLQQAFIEAMASRVFDTSSSIANILKSCPLVPSAFVAALSIAEKTQKLEETLPKLTEMSADLLYRYTQTLNNSIDIASKILIALLAYWIVLAIYQPIFSLGVLI